MKRTPQNPAPGNPRIYCRIYVLHPFPPTSPALQPEAARAPVPPRQPLPTAVIDPNNPLLKLGLDVHLKFIMVGVELCLNCPDRSWCRTTSSGTTERGDAGRPDSRDELLEEPLRAEGESKCFEEESAKQSEARAGHAG